MWKFCNFNLRYENMKFINLSSNYYTYNNQRQTSDVDQNACINVKFITIFWCQVPSVILKVFCDPKYNICHKVKGNFYFFCFRFNIKPEQK